MKIIVFLTIVLITICQEDLESYPSFQDYVRDYKKVYNVQQLIYRQTIYNQRVSSFASITFCVPGVNNLTDWTTQQINKMRSIVPSVITDPLLSLSTQYLSVGARQYPASLDWRNKSIITSIKDQGSCGSCWAFGVTAYIESMLIKQKGYGKNVDLSEQYLLTCTPDSDCNGGYIKQAIQVASKGMPFNSLYAYNPDVINPNICLTPNKVNELGSSYKYFNYLNDQRLIDLLQNGPVVVQLSATGWEYYQRGIFQCPTYAIINHVVLLVGYTQTYWILKNQWGLSFGQSGYIRISRNRTNNSNCYIGYSAAYMNIDASVFQQYIRSVGFLFIITAFFFSV